MSAGCELDTASRCQFSAGNESEALGKSIVVMPKRGEPGRFQISAHQRVSLLTQGATSKPVLKFKVYYRAFEQAPHSTWPLDWRIYSATDVADFSRASVSSFHLPDSLAAISLPMAALQAWMNLMR